MKTKSFIAALLLIASSAFAQVPSYVPTNGLVGWWPFNGNANDESGNGNNGTVNGVTFANDRFANNTAALNFTSSSNWVQFANSTPIVSNAYTFNFFVEDSWDNSTEMLIDFGSLSNFRFYIQKDNENLNCPPNSLKMQFEYPGQFSIRNIINYSNYNTLFSNSFIMISMVLSPDGLKSYINGSLVAYNNTNVTLNNLELFSGTDNYLGRNTPYQMQYLGKMDDLGTWNRALTQQEITALYNSQTCNSSSNTITADGPTTFCAGNYVNLTSDVVGGTYQWKKNGVNVTSNGTSRTYKATATGSYTCVATCNGTALTSNDINVTTKTNAFASVTASGATSFCAGDSVTLNCTNLGSNYSVQWYRTNISMENANNYSQVVKQPGTYKVVTKNLTTGCSRISGSAITTNVNCRIAGDVTSGSVIQENTNADARFIDNEFSQGVNIFPNPNSGIFSFNYDGEETGDAVLQIINNMGQSIYQSRLTVPEGGFTQDLQLGDNITKGIYIVRLLINDSYHDSKVMVK